MRLRLPCCIAIVLLAPAIASTGELAVLTNENWERLAPPGKEADCILGDYVLKSDRVWAVIAQPAPWRNANMTVRQVGGAVIDLTTVERPNDQLSAFYSGMRKHPFDKAEIKSANGKKLVLVLTAPRQEAKPAVPERQTVPFQSAQAALPRQPEVTLAYELEDGQPYLIVRSVFKNTWDEPLEFTLEDDLRADNFDAKAKNGIHDLFWVQDRYFEQAYGVAADGHRIKSTSDATRLSRLEYLPEKADSARITLKPAGTHELVRRLVPGRDLFQVKVARTYWNKDREHFLTSHHVDVRDEAGTPVPSAEVIVGKGEAVFGTGRTGENGRLVFHKPHAEEMEVTVRALGRGTKTVPMRFDRSLSSVDRYEVVLPVAPAIVADITDDTGRPIPCKVQFKGLNGTPNPNWGPTSAREAVVNLFYTPNGKFTVPIPPGEYEAIVSHGPEYDVARVPLKVEKSAKVTLKASLKRSVQSPGWISTDFHSHSSPSGDNTGDQRGRVLNLLAEHIEFAPCTEHNRLDSYMPHLKALGAERLMGTCTGIELTGTPLPLNHQNAFPMKLKPRTQDNGAPLTDGDPRTQIRRVFEWDDGGEKLVQQNHPDIGWLFFDIDGDGKPDGGFQEGFAYMHVIEVHPIHQILDLQPTRMFVNNQGKREIRNETIFNWLQLLNQGHRIPGVVNTDAHYNFHGSGGLRNWVRCEAETPGDIDPLSIIRHSKKGHIIMSTGPFMEVKASAEVKASGGRESPEVLPGDDLRLPGGKGTLHVRVQCPNWLDIDRVQVLVNGRPDPKLNFTRREHPNRFDKRALKFDQKVDFALEKDAHLIVVAVGEESEIGEIMGPMWGRQNPVAISNPIFADVDGNGFKPNGDTLDAPLPTRAGKAVQP